jgi:enoyl-CoA hydratase/carnithine racemase
MSFTTYERRGAIGLVTLNRPDRLNAISSALLASFSSALREATDDQETSVLVLTGAGRGFCSGDDLKEVDHDNQTPESVRAHITAIQEITHLMLGCDKPIIGAIHGYAVGGGFEWLLNCDIVVAAEQLTAFFPEFDWGYFVTGGVTHLLPQAIGYQRSMELMLLGERQSAADLKALGLVNFVVPQEQMEAKAFEVAEKIASKARFSVARLKRMLNQDLSAQLWRAVDLEQEATIECFLRPEVTARVEKFTTRKRN